MKLVLNGWWRLWIVLSIVYGVVVATLFWPRPLSGESIPHDSAFVNEMSPDTQKIVEELEFEDLLRRRQAAFGGEPPKPPENRPSPITLRMPNGHDFQIPGDTTEEQAKRVGKEYVRVLMAQADRKRRLVIETGFLIWLIPSVAVAVLGLTFAWIRRGFQKQQRTLP
jgi:hypothetical protein